MVPRSPIGLEAPADFINTASQVDVQSGQAVLGWVTHLIESSGPGSIGLIETRTTRSGRSTTMHFEVDVHPACNCDMRVAIWELPLRRRSQTRRFLPPASITNRPLGARQVRLCSPRFPSAPRAARLGSVSRAWLAAGQHRAGTFGPTRRVSSKVPTAGSEMLDVPRRNGVLNARSATTRR